MNTLSGPCVRTGLDQLLADPPDGLRRARLGLVSHAAAVTATWVPALDALVAAGFRVTAVFGPEHGFAGSAAAGDRVAAGSHPRYGIPIHSLYGATLRPEGAMLAEVDGLLVDLQDVGARFYTYTSTLIEVMRAAAEFGKDVVVLDRPNPITGARVAGPVLDMAYTSFVGRVPIPIRHGLTLGELALLAKELLGINVDLRVIPVEGWSRETWADETGLPWVGPSPAMPHLSTATLYPGTCLLEGVNVSVGRGTALPFEILGAPWIDADGLAIGFNGLALPGLVARPTAFTPSASRYAGQDCHGIQLHVTDRESAEPISAGLHVLATLHHLHPDGLTWEPAHFDRLAGTADIRQRLSAGGSVTEMVAEWQAGLDAFERQRSALLARTGGRIGVAP